MLDSIFKGPPPSGAATRCCWLVALLFLRIDLPGSRLCCDAPCLARGGVLSRVAWLRDGQESFRACEACVCVAVEPWCVVYVVCVRWLLQRTHSEEGTWLTCVRSFKATKLPGGTCTHSWGRGLCTRSQRAGVRAVLEVCSYHGATYVSKSRRSVLQKPIPPPAPALCSFEGFRS